MVVVLLVVHEMMFILNVHRGFFGFMVPFFMVGAKLVDSFGLLFTWLTPQSSNLTSILFIILLYFILLLLIT